jgi:hypothetical protein
MGSALTLILPGPDMPFIIGFGLLSIALEVFVSYARYASILKWTTLSLLAYSRWRPWRTYWDDAARGVLIPHLAFDKASVMAWWRCWAPRSAPTCSSGRPGRKWKNSAAATPSRSAWRRAPPARSCAASASTRWWAWSFPT